MVTDRAKNDFAEGYREIYLVAHKQYKKTWWWDFKRRYDLTRDMRNCQYHYKKLTGKNIEI